MQRAFVVIGRTRALVALGLIVLWPRVASAESRREQSVSEAVELLTLNPCLERPAFVDELEGWLERGHVDAQVRVQVGEVNGTLWFSIRRGEGQRLTRQFPDLTPDCAGQRRAVALSIALAIDALSPEPDSTAAPAPTWALSAHGLFTTPLPERSGLGGGFAVRRSLGQWFRPTLGAFVAVAPNQALHADLPVRFDTWLAAARVQGCFVLPVLGAASRLEIVACGGPFLGALTTVARGIPDARSETRFWGALAAALELHVRVTRAFGVHVGADAFISFRRSKIQVDSPGGQAAVHQELPTAAGIVRFGPEIFF